MIIFFVTLVAALFVIHAAFSGYLFLRPEKVMRLVARLTPSNTGYLTMMQAAVSKQPYKWLFSGRNWREFVSADPTELRTFERLMMMGRLFGGLSLLLNLFIVLLSVVMALV